MPVGSAIFNEKAIPCERQPLPIPHYQLGKKYQPSNRPKPTTKEMMMAMTLVLDISFDSGMIHPFSNKSFFQAHVGI